MPDEKLPRRERERLGRRQEMLAAALELFSEKGYHNVSMNEIAEKAEFAIGTLYNFFDNKEHLYKSIMAELGVRFRQALTKALEEGADEIEKLQNYVRAKGSVFKKNVSVIRLYFAETRGAGFNTRAGLNTESRKQYNRLRHSLAVVFERGIQRKIFKKVAEPYHLAVALDSICNDFLFLWLEEPEGFSYPEDPDVILNILFKGLLIREAPEP